MVWRKEHIEMEIYRYRKIELKNVLLDYLFIWEDLNHSRIKKQVMKLIFTNRRH